MNSFRRKRKGQSSLVTHPGSISLSPNMTTSSSPNLMVGVWLLQDAYILQPDGTRIPDFWGRNPFGQLIFTPEMHWSAVVHRSDRSTLPSDHDLRSGTAEQHSAIYTSGLSQVGTYRIDTEGRYDGHEVLGCSMPNWVGLKRTKEQLNYIPSDDGKTALERIFMGPAGELQLRWIRVNRL